MQYGFVDEFSTMGVVWPTESSVTLVFAAAAALTIPGMYDDLAAALEDAVDGDVIDIAAGDYEGLPADPIAIEVTIQGAGAGMTNLVLDDDTGLVVTGTVTITGLTLTGDGVGRPLDVASDGHLTLQDAEVIDGVSSNHGGLVYVHDSGIVEATSTVFSGGRALYGGAISLTGNASGVLTGCAFADNEVAGSNTDGGAVRLEDNAVIEITGSSFVDNRSVDHIGGAMALLHGNAVATLEDCTFDGNTALSAGGAIAMYNGNRLTVTGGSFRGGSAGLGGAISCTGPSPCALTVSGGTEFDANSADDGGHIYAELGTLELDDLSFVGGDATEDGGAISVLGASSVDGTDLRFETNHAGDDAGAVHVEDASLTLVRPWMCANAADDSGGAVYADTPATLFVTNATFLANAAASEGGAVRISDAAGTLAQSTFIGNTSDGALGAIAYQADSDELTVTGSVFSGGASPALYPADVGPVVLSWSGFWDIAEPWSGPVEETDRVPLTDDPFPGLVAGDCPPGAIPVFQGELVDAGDSAVTDLDASRGDIGATGGPDADPALWRDDDVDGVVAMWDCDDQDPGRSPLLVEVPGDGVDQDCDGADSPGDPSSTPPDTGSTSTPDTGAPPDRDGPGGPPEQAVTGCGCATGAHGGALAVLFALLTLRWGLHRSRG